MIHFTASVVVNGKTYPAAVTLSIIHQPRCKAPSLFYLGGNANLAWCSCTKPNRKEDSRAA